MSGPKPKPVEQKRREGNPGKRALPDPVLVGGRGVPDAPPGLSAPAAALWAVEVPKMEGAGLLDRIDGPMLGQYFEAWAMANASLAAVHGTDDQSQFDRGPVTWAADDRVGMVAKAHPGVGQWKKAVDTMRLISSEFGLTPSARASLGIGGAKGRGPVDDDNEIGVAPRFRVVDGGA